MKSKPNYDQTSSGSEKTASRAFGKFDITYFDSPLGDDILDEVYYKAAVDLGFTTCPIQKIRREPAKIALGLMKKYKLNCNALQDDRIHAVLEKNSPDTTQEDVDAIVREVAEDFAEFDNVEAIHLWDEPTTGLFRLLGMFVDAFHRLAPRYKTYINLLPNYAGGIGAPNYERYLSRFLTEVDPDFISYDHYHFTNDGKARAGFFTNAELIRDAYLRGGKEALLIVLLTCHLSYADLTRAQLTWEVNMCLVYGFKRVSYYQFYMLPEHTDQGWTDCCIDTNRKIWPHYYDVKEINKWLLPLGTELYDKTSTAVFHIPGTVDPEPGCRLYAPYGDLGAIEGQDLVIGFFDDGSFMIVNKKFEAENSVRTIVFKDIRSGLEYFEPCASEWKDAQKDNIAEPGEDGLLKTSLQPGAAYLFRVSNP